MKKSVAPIRLAKNLKKAGDIKSGELDPADVLFPGGAGEAIGRYALGTSPITLNTREAAERAAGEGRSLQSKRDREISKHKGYRDHY